MAPPSCRTALNIVDARPVSADGIVANATAWAGTNTCAMKKPSVNISARANHRLEVADSAASSPIEAATPSRPSVIWRRGPRAG